MADKNRKGVLGVIVDPTGADAGFAKIKAGAKDMAQAVVKAGQDSGKGVDAVAAATEKLNGQQSRLIESLKRRATIATQGNAAYLEEKAATLGVSEAAGVYIAKLREVEKGQARVGVSAAQTAAALRGVPAQFTDIVTSLQGGQAPLTVFLQQGGQLKDMFGGAGNAARALAGYVSGLINPFTLTAAAVVALGFALASVNGQDGEFAALNARLTGTGRASVATAEQMRGLVEEFNKIQGVSKSGAKAIIDEFSRVKGLGGEIFRDLGSSVADFAVAAGTDLPAAAKKLAGAFADPAKGAKELEEVLGTLGAGQILNIEKMAALGNKAGAQAALMDALKRSTAGLANDAVTPLGKSVDGLSNSWDKLTTSVGKSDGLRAVNTLLASMIDKVAYLVANSPKTAAALAFGSVGLQAAQIAQGAGSVANFLSTPGPRPRAGPNGFPYPATVAPAAAAAASLRTNVTDPTNEMVKRALDATKGIESQGEAMRKLRDTATQTRNALAELAKQNKSDSTEAKTLRDRLTGLNEQLASKANIGQSEVADIKGRTLAEQQYLDTLRNQGALAKDLTEGEKLVIKIQQELATAITGVARAQKLKALAAAEALADVQKQTKAELVRIDGLKKSEEAYNRLIDETNKTADALGKQADELDASNEAWGKGKVAVEQYRLALVQAKLAEVEGGSDSSYSPAYVTELRRVAVEQARKVSGEQLAEYKELARRQREYAGQIAEEANLYRDELALVGLNREEREKLLAIRRVEIRLAKDLADIEKSAVTPERKAELVAQANANATAAKSTAVAKVVQDEWQRTSDEIEKGLTDSLMRGFESGKGAAENLRDTVVNMFKTMVLRPTIQATVQGGLSALGLGGSGGVGDLLGVANNASSLNTFFGAGSQALFGGSVGASTASLFGANAVGMAGGDSLGTLIALNGQWAGVAAGASAAAAQAAIAANLAVEAGAGIALASGTTAAAAGGGALAAAAPLAGMGPAGWAALAVVAVLSIFGGDIFGGEKEITGAGISGTLSASGRSRVTNFSNYKEDGGWFGDDESGTELSPVSSEMQNMLDGATYAITRANQGYAKAIGLSADAVEGFTKQITINLLNLDQQNQQNAITSALTSFGDDMVYAAYGSALSAYLKSGETFGAALKRLGESLASVNTWLELTRKTIFEVSVAGADVASQLVDAFGGLEAFGNAAKQYYELYFTDAEKVADSTLQMAKAFEAIGIALPESKEQFRALATGLDLNTASGRQAYAMLLQLAPAFASTADSIARVSKEAADQLLKTFGGDAIDFAGLGAALTSANTATFMATMTQVFDDLAKRLKTVLAGIATERSAVAAARQGIVGTTALTRAQIAAGVAAINLPLPGNTVLTSAQSALGAADQQVAATKAALAAAKATAASNQQPFAAQMLLNAAPNSSAPGGSNDPIWEQIIAGFDAQHNATFGTSLNRPWSTDVDSMRQKQILDDLYRSIQDAFNAPIKAAAEAAAAQDATVVAAAQAALDAATANQVAALAAARQAQLAYIASLQTYAVDAGKATAQLGKFREATVQYYEQQKALANLMMASAANLRQAMLGAAVGALTGAQNQRYQQGQFDQNYALASVSTGEALAGYADKLTQVIPALSESLKATSGSALDYALSVGKVNAQAANVAAALEAAVASSTYEADSLALLAQIDAALDLVQAGTTSAEQIIAMAVNAGSDQTAAGLRAVVAALTGQTVPAFASGGSHVGGLRLVGENGPELEATGPSRIWSSSETSAMLAGGNKGEVLAELKALRADNRSQASAIVQLQTRLTKVIERWDATGIPEERVIA